MSSADENRESTQKVSCPSPAEIRASCAEIQASWTEAKRVRRSGHQTGGGQCVAIASPRYIPFSPQE